MTDLEFVFYSIGVSFSVCCTVSGFIFLVWSIGMASQYVTNQTSKRLKSTYRHIQLIYAMQSLVKGGRAQFKKDFPEEDIK